MVNQTTVIRNKTGLHLKPAARMTEEAAKFRSTITITYDGVTANAKSVLSVLSLCVLSGEQVEIVCNGEDEKEALKHMLEVIDEGLGDEIE